MGILNIALCEYRIMGRFVKSLSCISESNIILCVSYTKNKLTMATKIRMDF